MVVADEPAADETHHDGLEGNVVGKRGCRRYALVCRRSASVPSDKESRIDTVATRRDAGRPQGRRTRLWRHWGHVYPYDTAHTAGMVVSLQRGKRGCSARAISEPRAAAAVTGFSERRAAPRRAAMYRLSTIVLACSRYSIFRFYDIYACVYLNGDQGKNRWMTRVLRSAC